MAETKKEEKPSTEGAVPAFDFGKKRKKKKSTKTDNAPEEPEEENKLEDNQENVIDESKEQKEPGKETVIDGNKAQSPIQAFMDVANGQDYSYEELAKRIFTMIGRTEEKAEKIKIKPPVVWKEGTKKTVWVNFPEICKLMNRSPEHVLAFVLAEAGSTGSIDGTGRLIIRGRFQPKHVENLLRRYISEYVKCHTCKAPETSLKKENRLTFMVCDKCGSTRSVAAIKSGFQVTTRESRRANQK